MDHGYEDHGDIILYFPNDCWNRLPVDDQNMQGNGGAQVEDGSGQPWTKREQHLFEFPPGHA